VYIINDSKKSSIIIISILKEYGIIMISTIKFPLDCLNTISHNIVTKWLYQLVHGM
jgi:hypothetical protein